ncbi:MAG TPA: STAS domain-containing protein [Trebonia sp.]
MTENPRPAFSGDHTVLSLRGSLDFAGASQLRAQLTGVLQRGTSLLILDLSLVPACDAAGLAVLVGTQRRARLAGIAVCLVDPSLPVWKVLRSTGLDRTFTICDDRPSALAAGGPAQLAVSVA